MSDPNRKVRVRYQHYLSLPENGMEGTIVSGGPTRFFVKWDDEANLPEHWRDEPFNISVLEILSD